MGAGGGEGEKRVGTFGGYTALPLEQFESGDLSTGDMICLYTF